jgi:hypothetical protein
MFEDEEWDVLVDKLTELTRAQKVTWTQGESQDLVSTVISSIAYIIGSVDGDSRAPYFLAVVKMQPAPTKELARLESTPGNDYDATPQQKLITLQRLAYRMAAGGPQLFAELLAEMEAILPSPPLAPWEIGRDETPF